MSLLSVSPTMTQHLSCIALPLAVLSFRPLLRLDLPLGDEVFEFLFPSNYESSRVLGECKLLHHAEDIFKVNRFDVHLFNMVTHLYAILRTVIHLLSESLTVVQRLPSIIDSFTRDELGALRIVL